MLKKRLQCESDSDTSIPVGTTDKIHPPCTALVDWRTARGFTQADAAKFIGVTKQQIAKWEVGRALPRYRALQRLVAKTGLDAETIVGVTLNPKPAGMRSGAEGRDSKYLINAAGSDKNCSSKKPNRIRRRDLPLHLKSAPGRSIDIVDRLHYYTRKTDTCWLFEGTLVGYGYGQLTDGRGKRTSAHRLAYEIASGQAIPKGVVVCHRCDVPNCVNPDHLYLATQAENIRDAHRKGRYTAWHRTGKRLNGQPAKV